MSLSLQRWGGALEVNESRGPVLYQGDEFPLGLSDPLFLGMRRKGSWALVSTCLVPDFSLTPQPSQAGFKSCSALPFTDGDTEAPPGEVVQWQSCDQAQGKATPKSVAFAHPRLVYPEVPCSTSNPLSHCDGGLGEGNGGWLLQPGPSPGTRITVDVFWWQAQGHPRGGRMVLQSSLLSQCPRLPPPVSTPERAAAGASSAPSRLLPLLPSPRVTQSFRVSG